MGLATNDCLRKSRYDSRDFAEEVAKKRWREARVKLKVYGCCFCGGFHLAKAKGNRTRLF